MYYNVNALDSIRFNIYIYCIPKNIINIREDNTFRSVSPSLCSSNCYQYITFSSDAYPSYGLLSRTRCKFEINASDDLQLVNFLDSPINSSVSIVDNICSPNCQVRYFAVLGNNNSILGYCGKSFNFDLSCFGLPSIKFSLIGGKRSVEDFDKIDYFNHGDLIFKDINKSILCLDSIDSNNNPVYGLNNIVDYACEPMNFINLSRISEVSCGYSVLFNDNFSFNVESFDFEKKILEFLNKIANKNLSVVNEIIVDENSNVNIIKPNYRFEDSDNQGFWGR